MKTKMPKQLFPVDMSFNECFDVSDDWDEECADDDGTLDMMRIRALRDMHSVACPGDSDCGERESFDSDQYPF